MDRCERCQGPIERTDDDLFICPACGIWVHLDGAELGPPISPEQAAANYEQYVIDTATKIVNEANLPGLLKEHPENFATFSVRKRSTSAKDPK